MCACIYLHLVWQNGILPRIHFSRSVSALSCEPVYHYIYRHLGKGVTGVWCFLEVHRVHRPWEDPAAIRLGLLASPLVFLPQKLNCCQFWLRHNFLNLIFKNFYFLKALTENDRDSQSPLKNPLLSTSRPLVFGKSNGTYLFSLSSVRHTTAMVKGNGFHGSS